MEHEQLQTGPVARLRPAEHLDVTRGAHVADGEDWPTADVFADADGLPLLVVEHVELRQHDEVEPPVRGFFVVGRRLLDLPKFGQWPGRDDAFGADAIPELRRGPHEMHAASRADPDGKSLRLEQRHQLLHRLVGDVAEGHVERGVPGGPQEIPGLRFELFLGHAGERGEGEVGEKLLAQTPNKLQVTGQQRREGLLVRQFRPAVHQRLDAVDEKHAVHQRFFADERAVVVEDGDSLRPWHEGRRRLRGDRGDKVEDRLLGRTVVPGGQRVDRTCSLTRRHHRLGLLQSRWLRAEPHGRS